MKKAKLISLLLAAAMTASAILVSCAESSEIQTGADGTDPVSSAEEETEAVDERLLVSDDLPEENYDGYEFRMLSRSADMYFCECYTEEEDGEIRNDALYKRNRIIEDRFNVSIVGIRSTVAEEDMSSITQPILANEDAYDLGLPMCFMAGPILTEGYFINWNSLEYINLDKPWWISGVNSKFQIGDTIFSVVGDTCISTLQLTFAIFFNKNLTDNYGLGDMYQRVRDNKWTISDMAELCKGIYNDLDGDGAISDGDLFAYDGDAYTAVDCYPLAWDMTIIEQDDEGMPEVVITSEKWQTALGKINSFLWGDESVTNGKGTFSKYNCLFTTAWLGNMYGTYRDFKDEYGVIPYPKYDENQEKYMAGTMDRYSVLVMPITVSDPERTSVITEAVNAESYKILYPAWYEDSAQAKFARDEGTIEMLDVIMAGRNFDMATLFTNNLSGITWIFRELTLENSDALPRRWTSIEKGVTKNIQKIVDAYTGAAD